MPFPELHALMEAHYFLIMAPLMHVTLEAQYAPLLFLRYEGVRAILLSEGVQMQQRERHQEGYWHFCNILFVTSMDCL